MHHAKSRIHGRLDDEITQWKQEHAAFAAERYRQDLPVLTSRHPVGRRQVVKKQGDRPVSKGHAEDLQPLARKLRVLPPTMCVHVT